MYAAAAKRILDRLPPGMSEEDEAPPAQHAANLSSLLVFRLQREWLGLPTRSLDEVAGMRGIISLPHRRDPAVLGVTNVRGTLTVCVSLPRLLGLDAAGVEGGGSGHRARRRAGGRDRRSIPARAARHCARFVDSGRGRSSIPSKARFHAGIDGGRALPPKELPCDSCP